MQNRRNARTDAAGGQFITIMADATNLNLKPYACLDEPFKPPSVTVPSLLRAAPKDTSIKGLRTCGRQTSNDLAPKSSSWRFTAVFFNGSIRVSQKQSLLKHNYLGGHLAIKSVNRHIFLISNVSGHWVGGSAKYPSSKVQHTTILRRYSPEWGKEQMFATLTFATMEEIPVKLTSKASCVGVCWGSDSIWNMWQRFCDSDWIQFPCGGSVTEGQEEHWQERSQRLNYLRWQIWDPATSQPLLPPLIWWRSSS